MTGSPTIATYQEIADEYRERHADRSVIEASVDDFSAAVEDAVDTSTASIVDVGCGPGWESSTFTARGHDVVGVDPAPAFLRAARREAPTASFVRMDMRRLGFADDTFDGLWACASFLHVPRSDAPTTLAEFHRVLRPGGVVHVSVQQGDGKKEGSGYDGDRRRFVLYRPDELATMVDDAGFAVDYVRSDGGEWVQLLARAP